MGFAIEEKHRLHRVHVLVFDNQSIDGVGNTAKTWDVYPKIVCAIAVEIRARVVQGGCATWHIQLWHRLSPEVLPAAVVVAVGESDEVVLIDLHHVQRARLRKLNALADRLRPRVIRRIEAVEIVEAAVSRSAPDHVEVCIDGRTS